jgi:threonine dehydratase
MITLEEIVAAQLRIRDVARVTPIVSCGEDLQLKAESLQPIGSFKLRGAYNLIAQLTPEQRGRGVITYSSGNHAQGVAYSARALGIKAVIVMPSNAAQVKIEATRALGAEIVLVGPASEERRKTALDLAAQHGYAVVPPFDHPHIIAGQATCGAEILEQVPDIDLLLVPVSGGGLLAGTAAAVKLGSAKLGRKVRVIGVEPALAGDAKESFVTGAVVAWSADLTSRTIADGLRNQSIGKNNFEHIQAFVDDIVTITEEEILRAMRHILFEARIVAEPSGAVAAAAWLFHRAELGAASRPVAVVSGGNVEPQMLEAALRIAK